MSANRHALLLDRGNLKRRNRFNRLVSVVSTVAALIAVGVLVIVVGSVLLKGAGALSWHFLTTRRRPLRRYQRRHLGAIVGSAVIVAIAAVIAIPIGILVAIYTTEFAPPAIAHPVRFVLDILNGVPTIITGIFVYGLIVVPQGKPSGFAASIALAIVMLPIVARTAQEVLALVPEHAHRGGARPRDRQLADDGADQDPDRRRGADHRLSAGGRPRRR